MAGRCPVGQITAINASLHVDEHPTAGWQASVGYRWLHSDRHFIGTDEQEERQAEGSQVENDLNTLDFGLTYNVNQRLSFTFDIPYVDNDRSSAVRKPDRTIVGRSHVQATGWGDMRLSANWWLWDPAGHLGGSAAAAATGKGKAPMAPGAPHGRRGNIRVSIGVDAPTGDKDVKDYRSIYDPATGGVKQASEKTIVDQSIQPGDGGWGIPIDLYAYYQCSDRLTAYFQGSYLITPEEQNGVPTGRSNPYEAIMSIGDTWMARTGFEYSLVPDKGISVSLGLRTEGQPVYDLFGGSGGFRRPGMNIAVEPGISWMWKDWSASLSVPVTFYNERFQSVADKQLQASTGVPRHGDAAFADYYVMMSISKKF